VMALANQEAQRFNHEYIGTEHILLGLVKEGSGVGATVLKNLGLDIKELRLEVEKLVKSGPDMVTIGKLPQTPRAKKVIEYAIEEARALNHNYVGTEHILLGLLREREGIAAQVLTNSGLKLEEVRQETLNLLGPGSQDDSSAMMGMKRHQRGHIEATRKAPAWSFTDRAAGVMLLASQEAQRYNHEHIGTEHILLALLKEGCGVAATALNNLNVRIGRVQKEVERLVPRGPSMRTMGKLPQTPRAAKSIEYAVGAARALNGRYVGTQHILLGLLREKEGTAAQVLTNLGLELEDVRRDVLSLLGVTAKEEVGRVGGAREQEEPAEVDVKALPLWQKADALASQVYEAAGAFPKDEAGDIASRLRRAALAVPPHVARACGRQDRMEARWSLNTALASLAELQYLLDFSLKLGHLTDQEHQELKVLVEEVDTELRRFRRPPAP